jgi:hypothetical protein
MKFPQLHQWINSKKLYLQRISHNDKQLNSKSKSEAVTLHAMMAHILDLGTRWG